VELLKHRLEVSRGREADDLGCSTGDTWRWVHQECE
jgi:hypothetical protein